MHIAGLLAFLLWQAASAQGQSNPNAAPHSAQMGPARAHSGVLTFHVTARKVILDVIALDLHGGPVRGLTPADLKITYSAERDSDRHQRAAAPAIAPISGPQVTCGITRGRAPRGGDAQWARTRAHVRASMEIFALQSGKSEIP
jgi:hypothetical protein